MPRPAPAAAAAPAADGLAARRAALFLLHEVLAARRPLDEVLDDPASAGRLPSPGRDRAFARLLTATVLRRLGQIDALLDGLVVRPLPRAAAVVRDILRLGAAQVLFLGTPPHAAVATAVTLTETAGAARFKGLVNAVLRRLSRDGGALAGGQDAARLNTPDWLWEQWCQAFGAATARAIAEAHLREPSLDITVKRDPEDWARRLDAAVLPTGSLRRALGGAVADLPGYDDGAWWVQDAAAALPARLFGPVSGQRIADLCAAPGGKTAQLAAAGAQVTAVDLSGPRLARLQDNLVRLGLAAELVGADVRDWRPDQRFDGVLLDAPCTASGTIRRHPDIQWLKRPADASAMAALQAQLLARAADLVRPGGLLVWCTCSLLPEEGERQIERLLTGGSPFERAPVRPQEVGGLAEVVTPLGEVRTLPCHAADWGGLDGFHVARLRRPA